MTTLQGSIYTYIIIHMLQAITCCMTRFLATVLRKKKKKGMVILAESSFCISSLPVAVWMHTAVFRFLCGVWMSRHAGPVAGTQLRNQTSLSNIYWSFHSVPFEKNKPEALRTYTESRYGGELHKGIKVIYFPCYSQKMEVNCIGD